jgi:hypothetical protein
MAARGLCHHRLCNCSTARERDGEPMIMRPSELDAFVAGDTQRWAKAVKFAGAKAD